MRAESEFEGQCVKDLRALGYLVYTHADSPRNRKNSRSDSGYPDITFAGRGRVGFLELKMPKNKKGEFVISSEQTKWAWAITEAMRYTNNPARAGFQNALTFRIATPDNWDAILEELA